MDDNNSTKLLTEKRYTPKRKTKVIVQSNKNYELIQSQKVLKSTEFIQSKSSETLFKFFSKTDIAENYKHNQSTVLVQAQIHTPQNLQISIDNKNSNDVLKNKNNQDGKYSKEEFDKIHFIQPENLFLSHENEHIKSSRLENKMKWSLKIQLQSNTHPTGMKFYNDSNEMDISVAKLKKKNKKSDKIPKVLLPIKKKKSNFTSLNTQNYKNKAVDKECNFNTETKRRMEIVNNYNKFTKENLNKNEITESRINENILKRKSNQKLAPLFIKKIKPNSEILSRRCSFSHADFKESNHVIKIHKQILTKNMLLFPKVSHVNQLPSGYGERNNLLNVTIRNAKNLKPLLDFSHRKEILQFKNVSCISEKLFNFENSNIDTVLSEVKLYCLDAQNLWKSIMDSLKSKQDNRQWIDKYKPNSSFEVVGNEEAARKLKYWLNNWNSSKIVEDCNSNDEFYASDSSMSSSLQSNQVAVLIGPHGSGKSASVYAVAQELDYKVLEINASSKRHGKKLFKEFEEATKSHRVKKSNMTDNFDSLSKEKNILHNSLILLEDIDLVFEEDEGFISATYQLACNSKRPIVMTLKDTCSHLSKIAPHRCQINFQIATNNRVLALFELIVLAETGFKLPQSCLHTLCQRGDLRQGLNQLQYLLLSGKQSIPYTCLELENLLLKDIQTHIYKSVIKSCRKRKKLVCNVKELDNDFCVLVNHLNKFTLISSLIVSENSTSPALGLKSEPSISFLEDERLYSSLENLSVEIGNWLSNAIRKSNLNDSKNVNNTVSIHKQKLIKTEINKDIEPILSEITSNIVDHQVLALDYLSNIRTICRAEEIRNQFTSRRGNRFFHYLQNLRFSNRNIKCSNVLLKTCKIFQPKPSIIVES